MLWAFAVAQPLFDVLSDSPEFFVARANTRWDIVIFAVALTVLPPSALAAVELAALRLPRVRRLLHLAFVALLFAAFVVQVLDDEFNASSELLVLAAAVIGATAALAYGLTRVVPSMLSVLAPAPLVFLALFLAASPVSRLVLPQAQPEAADAEVRSRTPVVMLVLDELDVNMLMDERERIDRTRYPQLAAFARDATWYRNATSVNTQTTMAVPAMLSGRRAESDMLPIAADYPDSLFTLLGDSHDLHVTETATEVCPERLCAGRAREPWTERMRALVKDLGIVSLHLLAPDGLDRRLPAVDQTFGDFGEGGDAGDARRQPGVPSSALANRPDQFEALMRGIGRGGNRPPFHFLHLALPHLPWQYLPGGQQYVNAGPDNPGLAREIWASDPFPPRLGLQRALLQLGYVDRLVGRLTARLRSAGLYDRALVVITADHGVSFREGHPRRAPRGDNVSDVAGVPLLVKYPDRKGGRIDDGRVSTLDVAPTVAGALGVALPWEADGRSVLDGAPSGGEITIRGGSGDRVTLGFDDYVRRRKEGLFRMLLLFGAGDGGRRLYSNAGNWDLLGRPTRRMSLARSRAARVELDGAELLDSHRPGAHVVPSFLSGVIAGLPPRTPLAVAMNGTIRAVTESYAHEDGTRLAAVVPAHSIRAGANSVEVFAVEGQGGARRLAPLAIERPDAYRLVERDGATAIVGTGGRTIEIGDELEGVYDSFVRDDAGVRASGWAVDRSRQRPAERVLMFAGDLLVAQARPAVERPDMERALGPWAARSGFELRAAHAAVGDDDVTVVALSGDTASELPRHDP